MEDVEVEEVQGPANTHNRDGEVDLDLFAFSFDDVTGHLITKQEKWDAKQGLNRMVSILKKTVRNNYTVTDYSVKNELLKCNTKRKDTKFSTFLNQLKRREYQEVIVQFFSYIRWPRAEISEVLGHLTHHACRKSFNKRVGTREEQGGHVPLCFQNAVLEEWQVGWSEGPERDGEDSQAEGEEEEVSEEQNEESQETEEGEIQHVEEPVHNLGQDEGEGQDGGDSDAGPGELQAGEDLDDGPGKGLRGEDPDGCPGEDKNGDDPAPPGSPPEMGSRTAVTPDVLRQLNKDLRDLNIFASFRG